VESFEVRAPEPLLDDLVDRLFAAALSMSSTYDAQAGSELKRLAEYLTAGDRDRLPAALLARGRSPVVLTRGTVKAEGLALTFSVEAKDAATGRVLAQVSKSAPDLAHSVAAVTAVAVALREALGETVDARDMGASGGMSESLEADHEWALASSTALVGDYAKAAEAAERAVAIDPTFAWAHHQLGFLYFDLGRYADSTREYGIAARSPDLPPRRQREWMADWDSMVGRYDDAAALYEELARDEPEEWSFTNDLADTLVLARKPRRALEVERSFATDTPIARLTGMNLPTYCLLSGNLEEAVASANDFIHATPHAVDGVLVSLGAAQALLGRQSEARAVYERPVRPERGTYALTDLALFLGDAQSLKRLVPELAAVAAKAKGADTAQYAALLAEAWLRQGDRKGALGAADRAAASAEPWARYGGARVYESLADTSRLEALLSRSQEAAPDAAHVAKLLQGLTLRAEGRARESLAPLEEAKASVDSWPVHLELAESYLALGDRAAADKELRICLERKGEGALITMVYDLPTLRYVRAAEDLLARTSANPSR
jgi:tetratricopeptide (TPR) repeat protein